MGHVNYINDKLGELNRL